MTSQKSESAARWEFLDAARAIAVLLVILEHILFERLIQEKQHITSVLDPGRMGVLIFFVVSGFVIPLSVEKTQHISRFLLGRFFRLYPAYWAVLVAHFVLWKMGASFPKMADFENPMHWLVNITMFQLFAGIPNICLVAWTLGFEWFIYAGACFMIARREKYNPIRAIWLVSAFLGVFGIAIPLLLHKRIPAALPQCLFAASLGYAFFLAFKDRMSREKFSIYFGVNVVLQLVSTYVNYRLYPKAAEVTLTFEAALSSIFIAYFAFVFLYSRKESRFPAWLCWIGTISYSLYLSHGLLLGPAKTWSNHALGAAGSLLMMFVVGYLSYRLIEVPIKKIGDRLRKSNTPQMQVNSK